MKPKHFPLSVIFVLIVVALFSQTPLQAQHTPQQLAELMTQINKRLSKYDSDVQIDSFYHQCQYYIALSDKAAKRNDPTVLAERAVWRAILADLESTHMQRYLFSRSQRTAGAADSTQDWLTWSPNRLAADIIQNYQMALQDAKNSHANSQPYIPLFSFSEYDFGIKLEMTYPTLCDVIAQFFNREIEILRANTIVGSIDLQLFDDINNGQQLHVNLLQEMIRYHENDLDKTALLVWEIEYYNLTVKDSLKEQHLKQLEERYGHEKNAWILFIKMGGSVTLPAT